MLCPLSDLEMESAVQTTAARFYDQEWGNNSCGSHVILKGTLFNGASACSAEELLC